MRSEDEIKRDCTKCIYFDIETCYGVCDKHGIILNYESLCEDYEDNISCREVLKQWLQQESEG